MIKNKDEQDSFAENLLDAPQRGRKVRPSTHKVAKPRWQEADDGSIDESYCFVLIIAENRSPTSATYPCASCGEPGGWRSPSQVFSSLDGINLRIYIQRRTTSLLLVALRPYNGSRRAGSLRSNPLRHSFLTLNSFGPCAHLTTNFASVSAFCTGHLGGGMT